MGDLSTKINAPSMSLTLAMAVFPHEGAIKSLPLGRLGFALGKPTQHPRLLVWSNMSLWLVSNSFQICSLLRGLRSFLASSDLARQTQAEVVVSVTSWKNNSIVSSTSKLYNRRSSGHVVLRSEFAGHWLFGQSFPCLPELRRLISRGYAAGLLVTKWAIKLNLLLQFAAAVSCQTTQAVTPSGPKPS